MVPGTTSTLTWAEYLQNGPCNHLYSNLRLICIMVPGTSSTLTWAEYLQNGPWNHLYSNLSWIFAEWSLEPHLINLELKLPYGPRKFEPPLIYPELNLQHGPWNHLFFTLNWNHAYSILPWAENTETTFTVTWAQSTLWSLVPPEQYLQLYLLYGPWNHP